MGIKVDGIVDVDSRQKIVEFILEQLSERDFDFIKEKLQLEIPKFNTKPLEDSSNDASINDIGFALLDKYENRNS